MDHTNILQQVDFVKYHSRFNLTFCRDAMDDAGSEEPQIFPTPTTSPLTEGSSAGSKPSTRAASAESQGKK